MKKSIKNVTKYNGINKDDNFLVKSANFENSKHNNKNENEKNTLVNRKKEYKQRLCLFDHHNFLPLICKCL